MDHCCRKDNRIPEFSGVISTARAPPTPGGTRPWSSTTPQLPPEPRRLPATQPSLRAPQPPPSAHQHVTKALRGRARHAPPPFRSRIRPQPGLRTYRPSPPAPAPSPFPGPCQSPPCAASAAVQLRNTATPPTNTDQHRPTTPATDRPPAKITTIDHPARSSGRRGRGFKSRHPDAKHLARGCVRSRRDGPG